MKEMKTTAQVLVDCLEDIQSALCREVYGMRGKE